MKYYTKGIVSDSQGSGRMKELYSFDIYDTLITRKTATPKGIFALMQKCLFEMDEYKGLPDKLRKNFYLLRMEAERVARNTYQVDGVQDLILPVIYDCMRVLEQLTKEQADMLMQLEIKTECGNTLPIWENIKKVKTFAMEGKRVVLISDMYLETKTIRDILVSLDDFFADITMYVSGDIGKTKWAHSLYYYVKDKEQVEFINWHHYGDNLSADVEIPKRLGMDAVHYEKQTLLPWEQELIENRENNVQLQVLLGTSQLALKNQKTSFSYKAGCGFSAPLLLPYVLWILEESKKKGIEKLFFIARDGYILKKIADIVIKAYGYPVQTEYLYGSRRAWRLPAVTEDNFDIKELFKWSNPSRIYSYKQIAQIVGLTIGELQIFLPCAREDGENLSHSQLQDMIQHLSMQQKEIAAFVCEKYKEKRYATEGYLRQELGCENGNFAFVELIGSGYSQRCLKELTKEFAGGLVKTFFYRLDSCKEYDGLVNYVFFVNRLPKGHMIEVLCGASHGQTNGYEYVNSKWQPVFGQDEGQLLEGYGYNAYLQGMEDYVDMFCSLYQDRPFVLDDLSIAAAYFDCWTEGNQRELFDYFADMPYSITGREKQTVSFAPALTNEQLRKIFFTHKGENVRKYFSGNGVEFSVKRLTDKQKKRYDFYQRHNEDEWIKWLRRKVFIGERYNSRYEFLASEIIIYGAGKKGRLLYEQLMHQRKHVAKVLRRTVDSVPRVTAWVDKNFMNHQGGVLAVESPDILLDREYKQVVIAVARKELAEEIKQELQAAGVPQGKILWLNPNKKLR